MDVGAVRVPRTVESAEPPKPAMPAESAAFTEPAVVSFPDEVDLSNGDALLADALRLLREGAAGLVMDLGGCSFCDSSGPNAIFRAKVRADAIGVPMAVVLPETGIVRRICDIAGVTRRIPCVPDLASALALVAEARQPDGPGRPRRGHGTNGGRRAS